MRTRYALLVLVPVLAAAVPADASPRGSLTVNVEGVRSARGQILAELVTPEPGGGLRRAAATSAAARAGALTLRFGDLPPGDYAVRLFHDEDGDGRMKTGALGRPAEGFGFSNGARARLGPPSFGEMKVAVAGDARTVARLAY